MNLRWKIAQRCEALWWQRYLRRRPVGKYLAWKKNYWQHFLQRAGLRVRPGQQILDAGCGPAGVFLVFSENPVLAVDPLLEVYREKIPHFRPADHPRTIFQKSTLEGLRAPAQFDHVFCLNVINHVADPVACLQNLRRALAPGGRLHLSVDAHNFGALKTVFRWLPGDVLHPQQHSLADYEQLLRQCGFRSEKTTRMDQGFLFDYYLLTCRPIPVPHPQTDVEHAI